MPVSNASNLLTRSQIIAILTENYADLAQQFSVASLALFGSCARDGQTPQIDVDVLVTFSQPVGFGFMHLAHRLEPLLGKHVDLLAADGIKPNRRDSIHASLIQVAPSR